MNRKLVMRIILIVAVLAVVLIGINMMRGKAATLPSVGDGDA